MKLKKILAVILCVASMLGVMAAVAYVSAAKAEAAALADPPAPSTTTVPADTRDNWQKLGEWWDSFYPSFDKLWTVGFAAVSDFLVLAFRVLLKIVGLGTWVGPR